jgi:hypothetical protein
MTSRDIVLDLISKERDRQLEKWGDQRHSLPEWTTIATEELGEAAKHACAYVKPVSFKTAEDERYYINQFISEMIHTAAVCVAACEDAQRKFNVLYDNETTQGKES